jgi:hydroxymethylpyrimidine pyrophosphatase-like HAD family hydrolase
MFAKAKTIFIDIDGTIILHTGSLSGQLDEIDLLPGTIEKFNEWDRKGYNIILTTGRRESMRKKTEEQLEKLGIFYDQLIMGIGGGHRIIINDRKLNSIDDTCFSINIDRNEGIKNINL